MRLSRSLSFLALPLAATVAGLAAACRAPERSSDLSELYDFPAQHEDAVRNPVVVIPGLLGSRLVDGRSSRVVWGAFGGDFADPEEPDGARLISIPMRKGASLEELTDDVVVDGALEELRVTVFGLPIRLEAYRSILRVLGVGGYRDESLGLAGAVDYGENHFTCFQFAYDWRRGIAGNAARLQEFLEEKAEYVRQARAERFGPEAGDNPVRFDLVTHSLGGLVARWYMRFGDGIPAMDGTLPPLNWSGAKYIERAILVAPPNLGSLSALSHTVHGLDLGVFAANYPASVLGTLPIGYQLLPRARHGSVFDHEAPGEPIEDLLSPEFWIERQWGLAAPDQRRYLRWLLPDVEDMSERREIALDHQAKCLRRAKAVAAGLDTPARPPDGTELYLFCGDAIETGESAWFDPRDGALWTRSTGPGDDTVLRSSALGDERPPRGDDAWGPRLVTPIHWSGVQFLFRDHLGLVQSPAFMDNVLYLLLEAPRTSAAAASSRI